MTSEKFHRTPEHVENTGDLVNATKLDEQLIVTEAEEKMNNYTYLLCIAAGISGFLFGYDTSVISAALVNIGTDIGGRLLNDTEKEWVSAGTSCGALLGGLYSGVLADKIGRKYILAIGDALFIIGAVLICTSYSLEQLIIGRVVLGTGVGTAACVAPLYISELAPTRLRGTLVTIQSLMITGAQAVSYAIGAGMTFHGGWRVLFAISTVPAIVQAFLIHFGLPESPRYDLMRNRPEAARKTMMIVYKGATDEQINLKLRVLEFTVKYVQEFQEKHTVPQRFKLLMTNPMLRRVTFSSCMVMVFQQLAGSNTLMYYSATIFAYTGFNNPTATGLIIACTNFFFTGVSFFVLDRVGKRRILLITYPFMILGHALAAVAFYLMTKPTNGELIDGYPYTKKWANMMLGMLIIFMASYATGTGNLAWHGSELFPLELRGLGSSLMTASCWSMNIIVSATFLSMLSGITAAGTFGFYAGMCLLALIIITFCYPELSGLSLEEIQTIFTDGFGIRKAARIHAMHRSLVEHTHDPQVREPITESETFSTGITNKV